MIEAMIFDLDGTLVQTEKLKALSYARAVRDLCHQEISEDSVLEAFTEVVGLARQHVAQFLVDRFSLGAAAQIRMHEFGVDAPWQAFIQLRLQHYERMLADPDVILGNQWPFNLAVLEQARTAGCKTGLATMSRCPQATRILEILDLKPMFDFIATRDDVEQGKPDPEIYELVARMLESDPAHCLVLEDSPSGVRAALSAGMHCIAVTTPFTRESVPALGLLDERWIVHDPSLVLEVVRRKMDDMNTKG
jgi:beta-phosphoglucomutase